MRVLIYGSGSIGRRHAENLLHINPGIDLTVFDPVPDRLKYFRKNSQVNSVTNESELKEQYHLVLIATPPSNHLYIAVNHVLNGSKVFIEKPLSTSYKVVKQFKDSVSPSKLSNIVVGYNFRFEKGLRKFKEIIESGELGRLLNIYAEFGQYLPDWRPWQDYRKSYTARKELGGGIILDASHEIDAVVWLAGHVKELSCIASQASDLEVNVEDSAEIICRFKNRALGSIKLNFIKRNYTRRIEGVFEDGTISWNFGGNTLEIYRAKTGRTGLTKLTTDWNSMYRNEMKNLVKWVMGKAYDGSSFKEGEYVMKVIDAVKVSAKNGKRVKLK